MRQRKNDTGLPPAMYFKHGAYYVVRKGKWTNLGRDLSIALERYYDDPVGEREESKAIEKFLRLRITQLRARPDARSGRLKVVSFDAEKLIESARARCWRCAVTGIRFSLETINGRKPYAPSIDRIDNALDYVDGNVRVVCVAANLAMNVWGEGVLLRIGRFMAANPRPILDSSEQLGQAPSNHAG